MKRNINFRLENDFYKFIKHYSIINNTTITMIIYKSLNKNLKKEYNKYLKKISPNSFRPT